MMFLEIPHWVAPAMAIKYGLSWSLPSHFGVDVIGFLVFLFSDMRWLRMASAMYDVTCDCLHFGSN